LTWHRSTCAALVAGKAIVGQKEFYMSGQDVFRIDSAGRVMRHESAWDQAPEAIMSYLNPLAHIHLLEQFLPVFSNAVPKRPVPPVDGEDPEVGRCRLTVCQYQNPS
jgi:hypothetical protein